MRTPLSARVRAFLLDQGLMRPQAFLLVAVSGGPDSLCLLHVLRDLREADGPALHVAHLDHGVRGEQAWAEAEAAAMLAAAWGLPATVAYRDVPALAHRSGEGLQAAARRARYSFLAQTALIVGADAVAVAHQADDQAETVLLHAIRGAGLAGLRGMRAVVPWNEWAGELGAALAPPLLRPLLTTTRAAIMAYCVAHQLEPANDPSNSSPHYARTRVRRLLPTLTAENPQLVAALGRTAQLCADDYAFIQAQLDTVWPALATEGAGLITLRREPWQGLHAALQRYALRRAVARLGTSELSLPQIEAARAAGLRGTGVLRLGRELRLEVDPAGLHISRTDAARCAEGPQLAVERLPLVAATPLGNGWTCVVTREPPPQPGRWWVALDADALDGPLELRRRRPGDRFRPVGGKGSRKLQDFFVDRKLPRRLRDAWPILATPGAIVWVVGLRADARWSVGPATSRTIWVGLVSDQTSHTET